MCMLLLHGLFSIMLPLWCNKEKNNSNTLKTVCVLNVYIVLCAMKTAKLLKILFCKVVESVYAL